MFHCLYLLLLITLIAWRTLDDAQFCTANPDLGEAIKFSSLWASKDPNRAIESNMLWALFEMDLWMVINHKPMLSPSLFKEYQCIFEFKVVFHHVYIHVRHDLTKTWTTLSFLVNEEDITQLFLMWSTDWPILTEFAAGAEGTSKMRQWKRRI